MGFRMIKKESINKLLELLKYSKQKDNLYLKEFNTGTFIKVDLFNEEIIYPDNLIVHDKTTSNFQHPENFVVFECVNRLLSKGYLPNNIELEPRWKLGRGTSGGKADILIKDNNGHEYLIIECKTYGDEYKKAWDKTKANGDQLFSYAQQIKRTQYLCLYSSDIQENKLLYFNKIITLKDNEEYLKTLKTSKIKRYKEANDVKELHGVWKDIYNLESEETGIFEEGIAPYEINKVNTLDDLKTISFEDSQKKYNEFATILRQHNVSSHENAFDKLVNIFLAKIVDEIQHPDSLEFNWKGTAYDDYYHLQDRLQKLYKDGMQKFLNEEVTYIDNKQLNDAFKLFKNDPDATKNTVMSYFRELKFYTNNDFAFIDVHNEKLFKQNSEILLKIIRMFQDIKLKTEEQNQFLGDLFEGFLDDGVKQSEGQFFTPLPITRFIVSSLPLQEIINNLDEPPKVIDYACGAGHFLNEYANQIKKYVDETQLHDYYASIWGIEKEYRLSKVSKVSSFMYGQDEINVIYGDALSFNDKINNNSFDILIANPPYSVKGFLETLTEEEREEFELFSLIDKNSYFTNNAIETFFVEKAKQLLKDGGIAAIILPSSILTNGAKIYIKTREIILSSFDILSIVELPSGTFSATGTNTIILFLRKKKSKPNLMEHFKNRVNSWFDYDFDKDFIFKDEELLLNYLDKQNIEYEDYIEFIKGSINDNLKENIIFKQYLNENNSIEKIKDLEKDKLLYFMLLNSQNNTVLIVNAPTNSREKQEFLGYKWTKRKGNEGIKYNSSNNNNNSALSNNGVDSIKTMLFNPTDFEDKNKINYFVRNIFKDIEMESEYENISYLNLIDMVNFSKTKFDKSIGLTINKLIELKSRYKVDFLGNVCEILIGGTPSRDNPNYFLGDKLWVSIKEMNGQIITDTKEKITQKAVEESNVKLIPKGTTLLSFKLSIGKTAIAGEDLYTNEAIAALIPKNTEELLDKYLFYLFNTNILDYTSVGNKAFGKSLNSTYLKNNVQIPIPPIDIQQLIIKKCEEIDIEYNTLRMDIVEYKEKIEEIFMGGEQSSNNLIKLSDSNSFELSIGTRVLEDELIEDGSIDVISANVKESFGKIDKTYLDDYSSQYILWGIDGDWMVRLTEEGEKFYPTDHCGYIKVLNNNINPKYLAKMLEKEGTNLRFSRSFRASTERVSNIEIYLPDIKIQNDIINKVIKIETQISKLKNRLDDLNKAKENIVQKILELEKK